VVLDFYKPNGGSFALARRYLHGPAVDQVLAQENVAQGLGEADRVYWMLADNQGTVRDIVDHAGAAVGHFTYDAFGNILSGDTSLTRYLYTGREFDATTGLQYNRERWYDSHTGRWLSEDPIPFVDGSNNYTYVGNSPTIFVDPNGLKRVTQTAVSKSYIDTITNVGTLPTWAATGTLWAFAQFTNGNDYVHDGNVTTPAADGVYRLRAQIDISFDVNGDRISNLNVTHTAQGGQEAPGAYGTINVHQWEDRVSDSIVKVGWLTWGRPNAALEPVFQAVYPRWSKNIWHQVIMTISGCGDSADFTVEEFVGSDFPSHRLWVGAGLEGDLPQGPFSSLWRSDTIKGQQWVTRDGTGPFRV
jgi:RHS repeat-associated protein